MKYIIPAIIFLAIFNLNACKTTPEREVVGTENKTTHPEFKTGRTIILSGDEYTENESIKFITWKCKDYSSGGRTLVEFGQITVPDDYKNTDEYKGMSKSKKEEFDKLIEMAGFVLFEGKNAGEFTLYKRRGLNHRWDWGAEGNYSFIIKPDGTGLFYDFSTAKDGTKSKADDIYKCSK